MGTILLLGVGIFLGFFVQTLLGFAAPLLAMPILIHFLGIKSASALIAVFSALFSILMTRDSWKYAQRKVIAQMSLGSIIGIFTGVYILRYGNPVFLNKVLGIFILFFVIHQIWHRQKIKHIQYIGWLFGFIAGTFSGMFSSGGPFYALYVYNKVDKPAVLRGTVIGIIGIGNVIKIFFLVQTGLITWQILQVALYTLPFFIIAVVLGFMLYHRVNAEMFKKLVIIFLMLSGISLLIE